MHSEKHMLVGKVSRLHGYKGELSIKLDYELPFDYESMDAVFIEQNGKLVPHFIDKMRFTPQGFALIYFEGVDSEERAKRLIGAPIYLLRTALPELDEESYFTHELVGFLVEDSEHGQLGKVEEVIEHPGNTLLRIEREDGEVLIPLIEEFLVEVDKKAQLITVKTPEGLIDLNLDGNDV